MSSQPPILSPSRLKICLASWAPFVGGAEIGAERVALGLQAAGHDVFVVLGTRGAVLERMEQAGLRCIHCPLALTDKWRWWKFLRARQALRQLLQREKPDLVHSNDLPTLQMVASTAKKLNIPVVTYHKFPFDGPAIDWMNKYGADRHLFVSRALMEEMCARSSQLRESRRTVVHDGLILPPEPTATGKQIARATLVLPAEKLLVTFVGQIIERKGVTDLIRAWALLPSELAQRAELILLGDAPEGGEGYRDHAQQLAQELGCSVRFVGFRSDVGSWLTASDVMVLPSHVDPLPLAIMEAMSFGLPVIGCAVTGIPEMIVHEHTGLLVPPRSPEQLSQALARLLGDSQLRWAYGKNARNRSQEVFSLQAQVRQLEKVYREVLAEPQQLVSA